MNTEHNEISRKSPRVACCVVLGFLIFFVVVICIDPPIGKGRDVARRNACINCLRQIELAKEEIRLANGLTNGDTATWAEVGVYIKRYTNRLYCPLAPREARTYDRSYRINPIGEEPLCLIQPGSSNEPDHSLRYRS